MTSHNDSQQKLMATHTKRHTQKHFRRGPVQSTGPGLPSYGMALGPGGLSSNDAPTI